MTIPIRIRTGVVNVRLRDRTELFQLLALRSVYGEDLEVRGVIDTEVPK